MKTVFATRTKGKEEFDEIIDLVSTVYAAGIHDIYIISNFDEDSYNIGNILVHIVKDKNPVGPTSMNTVIKKIEEKKEKIDAFFMCSIEVTLKKEDIERLTQKIKAQKNLLVAGYKFSISNKYLNAELQKYYSNKNLIAYRVPWNTCAMWNYPLFKEYVGEFDEITNSFEPLIVSLDNVLVETYHKGMEDGLAIAKAAQKGNVYFTLDDYYLPWRVTNILEHRKKLARKDIVLRDFMHERNYVTEKLEVAQIP